MRALDWLGGAVAGLLLTIAADPLYQNGDEQEINRLNEQLASARARAAAAEASLSKESASLESAENRIGNHERQIDSLQEVATVVKQELAACRVTVSNLDGTNSACSQEIERLQRELSLSNTEIDRMRAQIVTGINAKSTLDRVNTNIVQCLGATVNFSDYQNAIEEIGTERVREAMGCAMTELSSFPRVREIYSESIASAFNGDVDTLLNGDQDQRDTFNLLKEIMSQHEARSAQINEALNEILTITAN